MTEKKTREKGGRERTRRERIKEKDILEPNVFVCRLGGGRGRRLLNVPVCSPVNLHSELTSVIDLPQAASLTRGALVYHVTHCGFI